MVIEQAVPHEYTVEVMPRGYGRYRWCVEALMAHGEECMQANMTVPHDDVPRK